jgi:hypothetical protein
MSRIITTVVQVFLFLGLVACLSFMWQDLKADLREMKNDLLNRK